jgi:hypothetical protein
MSDYEEMYGSRFLAAADLKAPTTVVIERIENEIFEKPGEKPRKKAVAYFKGARKGMLINKTNAAMLADSFGKSFSDWIGARVTIQAETTFFGSKPMKGLRLYPANGAPPVTAAAPAPKMDGDQRPQPPVESYSEEMSDSIDF